MSFVPPPWTREAAKAAGAKGRATQAARRAAIREAKANPFQVAPKLAKAIEACLLMLPNALGTPRGSELANTLRLLASAQRLLGASGRQSGVSAQEPKQLPKPE